MFMGNASIVPRNYRKYLYHAYLADMEAETVQKRAQPENVRAGLPMTPKEYGVNYEERHTKQGYRPTCR
ncbi:primase-like DNA-binding domain-containing protein [Enterobacter hormaechei]